MIQLTEANSKTLLSKLGRWIKHALNKKFLQQPIDIAQKHTSVIPLSHSLEISNFFAPHHTSPPIEVVLITHPRDFALARIMLRSLKLYCPHVSKVHVLIDAAERKYWVNPEGLTVNLVDKEAVLPTNQQNMTGYKQQILLKLLSYQLVAENFFWILDSDMLLTKPITDLELGFASRIKWYYLPWNPGNSIYKKDCEDFLGFSLPYSFMEDPFFLFRKDVMLDFIARYDLSKLAHYEHPSEFICYGGFCYKYYQHFYQFISTTEDTFAKYINQIPPSYIELNEDVCLEKDYPKSSIVAIYSHWYLALNKMIEFYHDSQKINFGAIKDKIQIKMNDYLLLQNQLNTKYFKGLYSDGWVEKELSITLPTAFSEKHLNLKLEVIQPPANAEIAHSLHCSIEISANKPQLYTLQRGSNLISVQIPPMEHSCSLRVIFEGGFKMSGSLDNRTFYARLMGCELGEKPSNSLDPSTAFA